MARLKRYWKGVKEWWYTVLWSSTRSNVILHGDVVFFLFTALLILTITVLVTP